MRTVATPSRNALPVRSSILLGMIVLGALACRTKADRQEVEVEVRRVAMDEAARSPVVLLEDKAHTVALPIWIGPAEAQAIAMRMEGVEAPRPLTHDLMKDVFDRAGIELRKVLIHDLRAGTYYARIFLISAGRDLEIDSRPSDAIALALRFAKPIFVTTTLLKGERTLHVEGAAPATIGGLSIQELSPELAEHFDVPNGRGVIVSGIAKGTASRLRAGDVIVGVNREAVGGIEDFARKLKAANGRARLSVLRQGKRIEVNFGASDRTAR